jgi:hypothetical protein
MFIRYHRHCGMKVIMMLSSSIVVVLFVVLTILWVVGLGRRNILLVVCFKCIIVLVLRITFGQVVLLWIMLNFCGLTIEEGK